MKNILIATKNRHKKKELEKLLGNPTAKILSLSDLKIYIPNVIEDGKTFRQNAIKKALTFSRYTESIVLADDSGLVVDALHGKPGIRSSRFAHAKANDLENRHKLLRLMKNVPEKKRTAAFICVIAIARGGYLISTVDGRCSGKIGPEEKGRYGFGYDPLFIPKGYNKTFAELKPSFKNRISHRAKAIKKAKPIIEKYL